MRAMVRRSVKSRSHQKLLVPLAAFDRRWDDARDVPAERGGTTRNVIAHGGMYGRVAYDAFLEMLSTGLELRLDQCDELRGTAHQVIDGRQHQLERDKADIDGDEVQ